MTREPNLFDLLACPDDHAKLEKKGDALHCPSCKKRYPIKEGIPIFCNI